MNNPNTLTGSLIWVSETAVCLIDSNKVKYLVQALNPVVTRNGEECKLMDIRGGDTVTLQLMQGTSFTKLDAVRPEKVNA